MALDFTGKYNFQSSENWDGFLKEAGVGMIQRKLMSSIKPPLEITQNDNSYGIKVVIPMRTWELKFELDKEFDDQVFHKPCKSIVTREGNALIHIQKREDNREIKTIREIDADGKLTVTLTLGEVTCCRIYVKE